MKPVPPVRLIAGKPAKLKAVNEAAAIEPSCLVGTGVVIASFEPRGIEAAPHIGPPFLRMKVPACSRCAQFFERIV